MQLVKANGFTAVRLPVSWDQYANQTTAEISATWLAPALTDSAGLGLVINGLLSSEDDWSRVGRPFHARTWEVLCSRTLPQAVEAIAGDVRSWPRILPRRDGCRREARSDTLVA